jgi:putative hydrolase of the HAD superfamily
MMAPIKTIFLDIGNVLLTNGWDRHQRKVAAEKFGLDLGEMNDRHAMTFDTYEEGKISLETYLQRVVFYKSRPFTQEDFQAFMFAQSQPLTEMIEFIKALKAQHGLRVATVSNEGRELTTYRIKKFKLKEFVDIFISSCFVHVRKPDEDLYRLALDCAQALPEESVYVDDRAMFVEVAQNLGLRGIHHTGVETTRVALRAIGLFLDSQGA